MDDIYAILEVSSKTIPRKGILPRTVCQKPQTNRESKFSGLLFSHLRTETYADFWAL